MVKNAVPFALFLLLIFIISCSSDSSDDLELIIDPVNVTYTNTIKAIMSQSCATTACHDNSSLAAGLSLTTYDGVKGAFENNGALAQIESGSMPKNASKLSISIINKITDWIDNGYKE
jgi:hypothetical protein